MDHTATTYRAGARVDGIARRWSALTTRQAVGTSTALATLTCLIGLGYQPLSWDEAVTASAAAREPLRLAALLSRTDAPLGAYYAGMHLWSMLLAAVGLTPDEALLRLPSALAAVGAVTATAALAASWYGPRVAVVAGALLATHPLFVFYAHDARPYTIAALFVVVATGALVAALRRPTPVRLAGYALLAVVAVYAHLFAVLALVAHAVAVARHGTHRMRWSATGAVVSAAVAPLVWIGSSQTGEIGWIPRPTPVAVAGVLTRLAGGVVVAVPLAALAVLVAAAVRRRPRDWLGGTRPVLLLGWAVLPPVLLVLADLVRPVLVARYALVAVPAVAIAVAATALRLRSRAVTALIVLAIAGALGSSAVQQTQPYKYENFRAATDLVVDDARPGDGVLFLPSSMRVGYDAYVRADRDDPHPAAVADVALEPGDGPLVASRIGGDEVSPDDIGRSVDAHPRIFLVGDSLPEALIGHRGAIDRAKEAALRSGYALIWTRRFGGLTVSLFAR
jgi:mannosyltransferase